MVTVYNYITTNLYGGQKTENLCSWISSYRAGV